MHWLNKLQVALVSYFFLATVAVHIANKELVWSYHFVSGYVHGPLGGFLIAGFYALVAAQWLVAYEHRDQQLSSLFFFLAGVGALLIAIVPIELGNFWAPQSAIHMIGAMMQFSCFPLALLFYKHKKTPQHNFTRYTGYTSLFFFIALAALLPYNAPIGLLQKIDVCVIVLWFIISNTKPGGDLYA